MKHEYSNLKIFARDGDAIKAAEILRGEIESRTGAMPQMTDSEKADISLIADPNGLRDGYKIEQSGSRLVFRARGIRGLIFAIGMFLRKIEVSGEKITLIQDIGGEYKPDKRIRGHQLGYRTTPNSYDAWDLEDYRRYYLDLMFFGCNTVEHIPYDGLGAQQNRLMKYDPQDFLVEASRIADEYDLDVSLWYPNDRESLEDAEKRRKRVFERTPRINVMFPPGGDPGDYDAGEFISRCRDFSRLLKEYHPNAEMWPSAQQIKSTNGSPVSTYVPFRNGLFLSSAASIAISKGCSEIYYGAHADDAAGSAYPDCSSDFNNAINEAIYLGSGKQIKVVAPFINETKDQVVKKGLELNVPYKYTWSCYEGSEKPCGKCGTCIDRARAFELNGINDPAME